MLQSFEKPSVAALPDVAEATATHGRALDWVGMRGIALPLRLPSEDGGSLQVAASVDVAVDLLDVNARGVHMSRMYLLLQDPFAAAPLGTSALRTVLQALIASQRGLSSRARLVLRFPLLLRRPALVSAHAGWAAYPVEVDAQLDGDGLRLQLGLTVEYSSTCPASAALSQRANAERFATHFAGDAQFAVSQARDYLASPAALAATPHAQRSRAEARVLLADCGDSLPLRELIDTIERALGTPLQTAVKREDEQAFARLNAQHLMFCEDAARGIAGALQDAEGVAGFEVQVAHLESLHAHDAVASVSGGQPLRR